MGAYPCLLSPQKTGQSKGPNPGEVFASGQSSTAPAAPKELQMKRVLITGVAGMIGSHLLDALLVRGYEVVGIDNFSFGKAENIRQHRDNPAFAFYQVDILNRNALSILAKDADILVHLAAVKKTGEQQSSMATLTVNTKGTENVLEVAAMWGKKVIFASTSDVYGMSPDLPFREDGDLLLGPSMVRRWSYAVSKLYGEQLAFSYHKEHGLPVVVLRYFGGFSPRSSFSWSGGHIPIFIHAILNNEEVAIHGDGSQTRSMAFVSDIVEGTVLALESDLAVGEIINLGCDEEMSVLDTARFIHQLARTPWKLKLKFVPFADIFGQYKDILRRIPDLSKAHPFARLPSPIFVGRSDTTYLGRSSRRPGPSGGPPTRWAPPCELNPVFPCNGGDFPAGMPKGRGLVKEADKLSIRVYLVVPVLNESPNIDRLLAGCGELARASAFAQDEISLILVDDGSTDDTAARARAGRYSFNLRVLRHERNRGPGAAFATAFAFLHDCLDPDDLVYTLEGDNTSRIPTALQMSIRLHEGYDSVLASPYAYGGGVTNTSLLRVLLSHGANSMLKGVLGLHGFHTMSSFFRIYRGRLIRQLQDVFGPAILDANGFDSMVEMLIKMVLVRAKNFGS